MKACLPAPSELLRGRAPGFASVDTDANGVVHRWMDLADRGNYLDAAERAAELLRGEASDVRLLAVYLVGWFIDRGAPALPELLACVDNAIGDGSRAGMSGPTARTMDSAMEWLFRAVGDRAAFQTAQRDEVWDTWLQDVTPEHITEIAARSDAISARCPGGSDALHKLVRWARNKLGPAAERAKKVATEAATEAATKAAALATAHPVTPEPVPARRPVPDWDEPDEPDDEPNEETGDGKDTEFAASRHFEDELDELSSHPGDHPPRFAGPRRGGPDLEPAAADATMMGDAPALVSLREKLRAFEVLMARGRLDRAAVVARDIQGVLAAFDPFVYLPSLLGRYARLLTESFAEIEPHWHESDSARWQVLVQFYRSDLAGFIDE